MAMRPQPKTFNAEKFNQIKSASAEQTGKVSTPKSSDEKNFPIFETPINEKVLVFIPNFTETTEEGERLLMDKGAVHATFSKNSYAAYRCINGIVSEEDGYDGSCPQCDAMNQAWELYRVQYEQEVQKRGLDATQDAEALQPVRSELLKNMAVKGGEVWLTFPIVVVETEEGKLIPKKNTDGTFNVKPEFFQIREKTYKEKWEATLDAMEDSPVHPGGHWFVLDYTYPSKTGKHDKRGSANALKILHKPMGDKFSELEEFCTTVSAAFTPQKSSEVIYANMFYDLEDLKKITDTVMTATRDRLAVYQLSDSTPLAASSRAIVGSPEDIASSFGVVPENVGVVE